MFRIGIVQWSEKIDDFENVSDELSRSAHMTYDFSQYDLRYMMCGLWEPMLVNF